MPRRNAIDVISPAWEHMKQILFPMRWSIWWRVALLGFLTGEMHSNGGFNFHVPQFPQQRQHKLDLIANLPSIGPGEIAIIAAAIVFALVVMVILTYIGSVCRFILFEAVLTRRFALREGWGKWQPQGARYFVFNLLIMFLGLATLAIIVIPAIIIGFRHVGQNPSGHWMFLLAAGALLLTVVFVILMTISLVYVLVKDFVVPQMALENLSLTEGWRRLWTQMRQETGSYAGYIGMKIVLTLGAALAIGLAVLIIVLILLIPTVVIIAIAAAIKPSGASLMPLLIVLVPIAIFVVMLLIFVIALLAAPATIFFPAYSVHFFADRYPPLAAILYPPPPTPPAPPVPPAPPLEPAPGIA